MPRDGGRLLAAYKADKAAIEARWLEGHNIRAEERAERSPKQQLAVLNKRLGKGVGAVRERKRLHLQVEQAKVVKAAADHQENKPKKKKKSKEK